MSLTVPIDLTFKSALIALQGSRIGQTPLLLPVTCISMCLQLKINFWSKYDRCVFHLCNCFFFFLLVAKVTGSSPNTGFLVGRITVF